ncbi:Uncharacterised protein [Chlamydia trachomatis]|nr:Uncharacterised protein [Chlamydia trachomatis]CRI74440.1 Uncharacterised protein [Chlamydia trachomatis]
MSESQAGTNASMIRRRAISSYISTNTCSGTKGKRFSCVLTGLGALGRRGGGVEGFGAEGVLGRDIAGVGAGGVLGRGTARGGDGRGTGIEMVGCSLVEGCVWQHQGKDCRSEKE